jgi:hypothetical protein
MIPIKEIFRGDRDFLESFSQGLWGGYALAVVILVVAVVAGIVGVAIAWNGITSMIQKYLAQ